MTEDTSTSQELLSQLPTNITIKPSSAVNPSTAESLRSVNPFNAESSSSVHASNAEPFISANASTVESLRPINTSTAESFISANASTVESLRPINTSTAESFSSVNPSTTSESLTSANSPTAKSTQPPKPRTRSIASLPPGISVSSVTSDSMKITNDLESKIQSNNFLSTMDTFDGEAAKEEGKLKKMRKESLSSINPSIAESTQSLKPRTLSINNLPPGISVSSVSCDSIKPTKIQSDDLLSAMDKFVEEDAKGEGKLQKMREEMYGDQVLDRRISNEDDVIAKADISFLATQVLKDVNHKLNMIANISVSLSSETTSTDKNTAKRKKYNDYDELSIFKDEKNIEVANGKRKRNGDSDELPIIKDADNIEISNSEMTSW